MPEDRKLINTITYLASLASSPQTIDPLLDTLRGVTARMQPAQALSLDDRRQLESVKQNLTEHLLHNDPVRSFTKETLDRQVAERIDTERPRRHKSLRNILLLWGAAFASYPFGLAVLRASGVPEPSVVAPIFPISVVYLGLIGIYSSALTTFTPSLRRAYAWLLVSVFLACIGAASQSVYPLFAELGRLPIFSYGGPVVFVAAVSFIIAFLGMRVLAAELALKSRFASLPLAAGVWTVLSVGLVLIPHPPAPHEWALDMALPVFMVIVVCGLLTGILGFQIGHKLTKSYARAVQWYGISYAQAGVVCLPVTVMALIGPPLYAGSLRAMIIGMLFGLCVIPLTVSGYMFSRSVGES